MVARRFCCATNARISEATPTTTTTRTASSCTRRAAHLRHNSREVVDFLSLFTEWRPYQPRARASVDGQFVAIPINPDTVNQLYGTNMTSFELEAFFASVAESVPSIRTSEDVFVSRVGAIATIATSPTRTR